jgi:uncharacterized protein (DUF1330 family)
MRRRGSSHRTDEDKEHPMSRTTPGYAVAYLRDVDFNDKIVAYLERIDATMEEYGGRFVVHGGQLHPLEGEWPGALVVIEFPSTQAALDWYASPAYQEILPLRTENTHSIATVVDGMPTGYRATDRLERMPAG